MKRAVVLCALVGVAVYATTAWSASSADPTEAKLQRDVATLKSQSKTLQSQVKTLQSQVKTLQKDDKAAKAAVNTLGDIALTNLVVTICSDEIAADAFQGTWQVIDQLSAAVQSGKTYFGVQPAPVTALIQGQDVCATLGVTRSPSTTGLAPTIAQYQALLAPFHSSSASLSFGSVEQLFRKLNLK